MSQLFGSEGMSAECAYWRNAGRDGDCFECGVIIETGERIVWDEREERTWCAACGEEIAGYADPNGDEDRA